MELAEWADRAIRNVSESGERVETIRLISTDGVPWETWWSNEFGTPEDWTDRAERRVAELAEDWPPQEVQILFVGENKAGNVITQCTKRVRGRAKGASANVFGGPGKALADSMDAQARTMDRILATANGQLESLCRSLELSQKSNEVLAMALQAERLARQEQAPVIDPELVNQGIQMLPALFEMLITKSKG